MPSKSLMSFLCCGDYEAASERKYVNDRTRQQLKNFKLDLSALRIDSFNADDIEREMRSYYFYYLKSSPNVLEYTERNCNLPAEAQRRMKSYKAQLLLEFQTAKKTLDYDDISAIENIPPTYELSPQGDSNIPVTKAPGKSVFDSYPALGYYSTLMKYTDPDIIKREMEVSNEEFINPYSLLDRYLTDTGEAGHQLLERLMTLRSVMMDNQYPGNTLSTGAVYG
ncbi:hypothetical protein CANARDRAFT_26645 [[Candida] arabinofermentans NRRL YB-2248]|uniref:Uncharacterized protein n=1 Tax=[Candida] arabinofermentans NRRL YB-2248 TaxID=983967 RepID=A0A1E4T650_9ASCO|nr:hypothetical protein CANARDRAFT_26645 [[Candida] arabinofermentans NRRL YB-2248]